MRRQLPVALLATLLASALLGAAPALGAGQRGHVFEFAFGGPGKAEGQFLHPDGIAVNASTGDLYVADRDNGRIEEFKPKLGKDGELIGETFVAAWKHVGFPESIAVDNSFGPSAGDVYVADTTAAEAKEREAELEPEEEDLQIKKFTATGEKRPGLKKFKGEELEAIKGLAVDAAGNLFVYDEGGEIYEFNDAKANKGLTSFPAKVEGEHTQGLAVNSLDDLYVGTTSESEAGELVAEEQGLSELPVIAKIEKATGDVLSAELDTEPSSAVAVNPLDEPANEVDEANDVYVANVNNTEAGQVSTIAEFNEHGELVQRFGAPASAHLTDADAITVDQKTGTVYVADAATDQVDVFGLEPAGVPEVGNLSACTLGSSESGCPAVTEASTLKADVDPHGAATTYHFEYGEARCASVPTPCTSIPAKGEEPTLAKGFGEQQVSVELPHPLAAGLYYYRVAATNEFGTVYSQERTFSTVAAEEDRDLADGREWELVTPPCKDGSEPEPMTKEGGLIEAAENGHSIAYVTDGPMPCGARVEGNRSPELTQILSTRGSDGWESQDLNTPADRGSGVEVGVPREYRAFSSSNLSLALVEPFAEADFTGPFAKPALSPPLSSTEKALASEGKEYQEKTIYLRDDAPLAPGAAEAANFEAAKQNGLQMSPANPGFLPLVTEGDAPGGVTPFGGARLEGIEVEGQTPDLAHVVIASHKAEPGLYESGWGTPGAGELLRQVSVLPKAEGGTLIAPSGSGVSAHLGVGTGNASDVSHAISEGGQLVFWETHEPKPNKRLYVRNTETQETIRLDVPEGGVSVGSTPNNAVFQTASADGTKVFFTDTQRLTADSRAREEEPDLYVAELNNANPLSYTVTDLTPQGVGGESADVMMNEEEGPAGGVIGASEDGSYVYFVADGALVPGAPHGNCLHDNQDEEHAGTCNLYVSHFDGSSWTTKLVATLSGEDSPDWDGAVSAAEFQYMTARVSPDGEYIAFMSDRAKELTGYDNVDANEEGGPHLDEEVFLYDAGTGRLTCASCNPTGAQPHGIEDLGEFSAGVEGSGLLVDEPETWAPITNRHTDHWLAASVPGYTGISVETAYYQSRYLSNSGRLFFESPDKLVAASESDKEKVYEYEPNSVGSCESAAGCISLLSSGSSERESAFLDASANGNDVFFMTTAQLVPQDTDEDFDIYDAHVCEASSPCLPPPPAPAQECQETPELPCKAQDQTTAPALAAAASAKPSGSTNIPAATKAVLPVTIVKPPTPKPLTKAQLLAKALKACKKDKKKSKRLACEKAAQKKYGKAKKSAKKAKKSSSAAGKGKA